MYKPLSSVELMSWVAGGANGKARSYPRLAVHLSARVHSQYTSKVMPARISGKHPRVVLLDGETLGDIDKFKYVGFTFVTVISSTIPAS